MRRHDLDPTGRRTNIVRLDAADRAVRVRLECQAAQPNVQLLIQYIDPDWQRRCGRTDTFHDGAQRLVDRQTSCPRPEQREAEGSAKIRSNLCGSDRS
jgi:hypothetical protein